MEKWKKIAAHIGAYPAALAKWLAVGALIGGIGGGIGSLFHIGVNYATQMRAAHPWILYLLPVLGLIIVGLYRVTKVEGKDTNAVIESVHFGKNVPVLLVPVIFISTVLTHLGGGSAGREGAALQIGGGIGFEAGRLLRLFAPVALVLYLDALVDGMLKGLSEQVANVRYNTITSALDVALLFVLLQNKSTTLKNWLTNTQSSLSKMVWMKTTGTVGKLLLNVLVVKFNWLVTTSS